MVERTRSVRCETGSGFFFFGFKSIQKHVTESTWLCWEDPGPQKESPRGLPSEALTYADLGGSECSDHGYRVPCGVCHPLPTRDIMLKR